MIEIIQRCEGEPSQKEQFDGTPQISYNSYGHLAIRLITGPLSDTLIVLNTEASREVIDFCQNSLRNQRRPSRDNGIPF